MEEISNNNLNKFIQEINSIGDRYNISEEEKKVSANVILGRLGFFYEKVRNTLEYQDEHLIFKSSLSRILRRKLSHLDSIDNPAKEIVEELIIGGYLDNNKVPESYLDRINNLVTRYRNMGDLVGGKFKKNVRFFLACSLEEFFNKEVLEKEALVEFTKDTILENIKTDISIDRNRLEIQLYIAIHKSLIKSDYQTIRYRLLKKHVRGLEDANIDIHSISTGVDETNKNISLHFKDPLAPRFTSFARKSMPPFSILGKLVADSGNDKIGESLKDEAQLRAKVDTVYSRWKERAYDKISRSALRSVIFIFFTKIILALAIELPYEIIILDRINYLALGLNLMFPPLYMFASTYNIKVPGRENLIAIKDKLSNIVFRGEALEYHIRLRKSSSLKKGLFFLIYLLTFVLSFGGLVYGLYLLEFSWVAGVLFFVFFSTVSFFAYRISQPAKGMQMTKKGGSIRGVIIDFFSIPFIKLGQFLSSSFSQVNVFLFFFDFIVETPFKTIIKFMDEWVSYAREKKDDILDQ